jgi:hypothetical protein
MMGTLFETFKMFLNFNEKQTRPFGHQFRQYHTIFTLSKISKCLTIVVFIIVVIVVTHDPLITKEEGSGHLTSATWSSNPIIFTKPGVDQASLMAQLRPVSKVDPEMKTGLPCETEGTNCGAQTHPSLYPAPGPLGTI